MLEEPHNIPADAPSIGIDKVIMLVGGTDCSGGAGLAADIATCRLVQTYPMPVVSCITAQGSRGLHSIQPTDTGIFRDQLECVLSDVRPDAVKIGMLPSAEHMRILAEMLLLYPHGPVVFDPVLSPTLGSENFDAPWQDDTETLHLFLKQVDLVTPNADELRRLVKPIKASGKVPEPQNEIFDFKSRILFDMHLLKITYDLRNLLLTGGHNPDNELHTDFLLCSREDIDLPDEPDFSITTNVSEKEVDKEVEPQIPMTYEVGILPGDEIDTPNTHGTGCVYSTAIAAFMAQDMKFHVAVPLAKQLVTMLLKSGKNWRLYSDAEAHGPAFSVLSISKGMDFNPIAMPGFLN